MILPRVTAKPKLLWAMFAVLLVTVCTELPIVVSVLISGNRTLALIAYWLGISLWVVGFTLAIIYIVRFVSGKYNDLKLVSFRKQRW